MFVLERTPKQANIIRHGSNFDAVKEKACKCNECLQIACSTREYGGHLHPSESRDSLSYLEGEGDQWDVKALLVEEYIPFFISSPAKQTKMHWTPAPKSYAANKRPPARSLRRLGAFSHRQWENTVNESQKFPIHSISNVQVHVYYEK